MEQTILTAVSAVGFPIVVTFYLLTSFQKSIQVHGQAERAHTGTPAAGKVISEQTEGG